jgi:hypothetical protein
MHGLPTKPIRFRLLRPEIDARDQFSGSTETTLRRAVNHRLPLLLRGRSPYRPTRKIERTLAESRSPKPLAERADLVHDRVAYPADRRDAHKLKNNQHVQGSAIEHQMREAMP